MTARHRLTSAVAALLLFPGIASGGASEPRPYDARIPTQILAGGRVYQRSLALERVRFRRDGDPVGKKGEVEVAWEVVPNPTAPLYRQSGSYGTWKMQHSKKPKKCSDDGCDEYGTQECRWHEPNRTMFTDWSVENFFCDPMRVRLDFDEKDRNRERLIGSFATGGTQPHLDSPTPSPGSDVSVCEDFPLVNTLNGEPARLALRWSVDRKLFGSLAGKLSCGSDTASCGEIESYAYQHINGPEMRSAMLLETIALDDYFFTGVRRIDIAYDIDADPETGDDSFPLCGADYRVFINLEYPGSGAPPVVTKRLEVWNDFGSVWGLTGLAPYDFELSGKRMELIVKRDWIGSPDENVVSWATFAQNGLLSGVMPCFPCEERIVVPIEADVQCPQLLEWDDSELAGGNSNGVLSMRFDEPMGALGESNLTLDPALPFGTTLTVVADDTQRAYEVSATPRWTPGRYTLGLSPLTSDVSGNAIARSSDPGTCGVSPEVALCIEEDGLAILDGSAVGIDEIAWGTPVYASGSGFIPTTIVVAYLAPSDAFDVPGAPLVDFTHDGPSPLAVTASGTFTMGPIGVPVAPGDYALLIDDGDGVVGAGDRRTSWCSDGIRVTPACEDDIPMIAAWPFDQASGGWVGELSAGVHHGQIQGAPSWTPGIRFGGLQFDGATTRVVVPASPELLPRDEDFSVSAWIRASSPNATIVAHHDGVGTGYVLSLVGGRPSLLMEAGATSNVWTVTTGPDCTDGQWHFVAAVVDRENTSGLRLFVDGVPRLLADPTALDGDIQHAAPLVLGGLQDGSELYSGDMDQVELTDHVFSIPEIAARYAWGILGACPESSVVDVPELPVSAGAIALASPRVVPNPAPGATGIHFNLPADGEVALGVYDVSGRRVAQLHSGRLRAGSHTRDWNRTDDGGRRVPPGVYFVRLRWNDRQASRTAIVL